MRLGIFGGTFDPVHLGHLILAEQCREQARLAQVLFMPAAQPPHKPRPQAPFAQRVEMLQLAIAGNPTFGIDEIEAERSGPSYTADTLEEQQRRRPTDELFLIVGADSLRDFPTWYQPERILRRAALLVVARPDAPAPDWLGVGLPAEVPVRCHVVTAPLIGIASRDLRRRLAEGRSVRYQLPRAVEAYIQDKGLYRKP
jgi:nicotinate-nucleotide adenylyltransferase